MSLKAPQEPRPAYQHQYMTACEYVQENPVEALLPLSAGKDNYWNQTGHKKKPSRNTGTV
jgi:hypothetical protein